jgi:hypothetical protein
MKATAAAAVEKDFTDKHPATIAMQTPQPKDESMILHLRPMRSM